MSAMDATDDIVLLDVEDLVTMLKVKKSWIYDEVQAGRLPAIKLGQRLRFRRADILAYLNQHVVTK